MDCRQGLVASFPCRNMTLVIAAKNYGETDIIVFWSFPLLLDFFTLSLKCPNTEFFLAQIRKNTDQKKLRIWTFSLTQKNIFKASDVIAVLLLRL